jgi:hypothetical protein
MGYFFHGDPEAEFLNSSDRTIEGGEAAPFIKVVAAKFGVVGLPAHQHVHDGEGGVTNSGRGRLTSAEGAVVLYKGRRAFPGQPWDGFLAAA